MPRQYWDQGDDDYRRRGIFITLVSFKTMPIRRWWSILKRRIFG